MPKSLSVIALATLALVAWEANRGPAWAAQDDTSVSGPADPAAVDDNAPVRASPVPEGSNLPLPDDDGVMTINWDDLLPEGEMERIEELYRVATSMMSTDHFGGPVTQIGTFNVEEDLVGRTVRLPGYILPLDLQPGGEIREFLLVPYFGACVHTPPPPPNQIVYVTASEPIQVERLWAAVWVTGELSSDRHMNEVGDAAYTMELVDLEPYRN